VNERDVCISLLERCVTDGFMLGTIISRNEALRSKLLHWRFRTMREQQHVPVVVSHIENVRFRLEKGKKKSVARSDRVREVLIKFEDKRRKIEGR
jgi:hypothetical protein